MGVRHGQLLLGLLALWVHLSCLSLVHLTVVLSPHSPPLTRPFPSLASLHPGRLKREIGSSPNTTKWVTEGHPVAKDEDGKAPIPVETTAPPTRSTTQVPTTFIFSNPPTSSTKTTTTSSSTKRTIPIMTRTTTTPVEETTLPEEDALDTISLKPHWTPEESRSKEWTLDTAQRLLFFSSGGLGMLLGLSLFPIINSLNPRFVSLVALLLSSFVTAWQPFLNYYGSFVARLLQGTAFSLSLTLVYALVINWAPIKDRSYFITTLLLAFPFASLIPWPLAQLFSDQELPHWAPFALLSLFAFLTALLILFLFKPNPYDHTAITGAELDKVRQGKTKEDLRSRNAISNLRSTSFWAVSTSCFGFGLAIALVSFYLPSLLASSAVMWTWNLGVTASIPFIAFVLFFFVVSFMPSSATSSRILNTIALIATAVLFIIMPILINPDTPNFVLPSLLAPLGLFSGGALHLSVVHASVRTIPSIFLPIAFAYLLVPPAIHFFVFENRPTPEWLQLCLFIAFLLCVAAAPFAFFAKAILYPKRTETTLRYIEEDEECGITELQLLPPAGKHLK